jgi:excisionase family DNA binding protein
VIDENQSKRVERKKKVTAASIIPVVRLSYKPVEAAAMLSISERSLWSLMNEGKIRSIKIGTSVRYPHSELERFLSSALDVAGQWLS